MQSLIFNYIGNLGIGYYRLMVILENALMRIIRNFCLFQNITLKAWENLKNL